ncbi:LicD family protein [Ruminococcus champanellensis]|jgi:lipopolysaccharide cholinephosphotransferase|uniref:LicD family protein n=1 Tax=Ruminococcus champanellensis TaxID=1161942 RepID=UPI0023F4FBD4|nr:LicD family protein [Ruminococcus champanellensis]
MRLGSLLKTIDSEAAGLHVITDEELKNAQHQLLAMLLDVAALCEKHQINWSLSGGSIIGAVRHKGFIPWDDDIDIFMTRDNVNKFSKVFHEISDKYELAMPGDKGNIFHYPRLYKKGTKLRAVQSAGETHGLVLDIFILENTYDSKIFRTLHGMKCSIYLFIDSSVRTAACEKSILKYSGNNQKLIKAVKFRSAFAKLFSFRTIEQWMAASDKAFSSVKNTQTKYVVCPSGGAHFFGEIFIRPYMVETVQTDFEGHKVNIPSNSDYYLRKRYGEDYMTIPKESAREKHAYVEFEI